MPRRKIHSFSRSFAQDHSVNEAVILKYVAYKVGRSKNWQDEKQWYYGSIKELQEKIPYISSSAIDANIRKMGTTPLLEIGNYNHWKQDRTRWFHVPKETRNEVESDLIKFDHEDAVHHGIPAAVLLLNLRYWIMRKLKKSQDTNVVHEMSPAALSNLLPYSESTIKATLKTLVEKGVILKTSTTKPEYTLPPNEMQDLRREAKLKS